MNTTKFKFNEINHIVLQLGQSNSVLIYYGVKNSMSCQKFWLQIMLAKYFSGEDRRIEEPLFTAALLFLYVLIIALKTKGTFGNVKDEKNS